MTKIFVTIYFCIWGSCSVGWIDEPLLDYTTCNAYANAYMEEIRLRAPESSGEMYCLEEQYLADYIREYQPTEFVNLEEMMALPKP
jgi:hypothetical protein|tara:strand:- start:1957 stop:2214 length:258 start_codon:yes stop_codon:yes gene_type:complete